jgi:hypothetical protein
MTPVSGMSRTDRASGADALIGPARRHPDVRHHDVRLQPRDGLHQHVRIRELGDHVESSLLEDPRDTGTKEQRVVNDHGP